MLIGAACQFSPRLLSVRENVATAQALAHEAALKGAKFIVLPELCTSGNVIRDKREAMLCAQTKDGWQTRELTEVAVLNGCYIVMGYVELHEGRLHNSAVIVGPQGLLANVRKKNLWGSDFLWATPGEQLVFPTVTTPYGRLGALICKDVGNKLRETHPLHKNESKFYQKGSVDVLAVLVNWGSSYGFPDSSWMGLVEQTGSNVIIANRYGKERDARFKGGSCVVSRDMKVWTNGVSFTDDCVVGGELI